MPSKQKRAHFYPCDVDYTTLARPPKPKVPAKRPSWTRAEPRISTELVRIDDPTKKHKRSHARLCSKKNKDPCYFLRTPLFARNVSVKIRRFFSTKDKKEKRFLSRQLKHSTLRPHHTYSTGGHQTFAQSRTCTKAKAPSYHLVPRSSKTKTKPLTLCSIEKKIKPTEAIIKHERTKTLYRI